MAQNAAATPFHSILGKATWSSAQTNRLPDSSFLLIEPGGSLDDSGRTTPRSLRHLPVYDSDGALDLPHLRNAIAQIPKAGPWLTADARKKLQDKARRLLETANETTHKSAASVPDWALGYLAHADIHDALALGTDVASKAWRGDALIAKRAADWAKARKAAKARAPRVTTTVEKALRQKVAAHNAAHAEPGQRVTMSLAKAVYQRGTAAYASAGRPVVKSAVQWGNARTNAFLRLLSAGAPHVPEYQADNDLLPAGHPLSPKTKAAPTPRAPAVEAQKDEMTTGDLAAGGGLLVPEQGTSMPRRSFQGIPVVVDRPKGFVQRGKAKDGTEWERVYKTDYGFIPSTLGGDDEELDVFLGPDDAAPTAYWVAQTKDGGAFDEYKVFLGYPSEEAARACYLEHIPAQFMGAMFATPVGALHALLGMNPAEMQQETSGTPEAVVEAARAAVAGEDPVVAFERLKVALAALMPGPTSKAGEKYADIDFKPPQGVRDALKRGLELHEQGYSGDGLQPETVSWATKLARGESVSPDKARKMSAWFARHAVDEKPNWASDKTPGYVAWMLWGGDAGRAWSSKLVEQMDARDTAEKAAPKHDADPGGEVAEKAEARAVRADRLGDLSVRERMLRAAKVIGAIGTRCADAVELQANRDSAVHDFWPAACELLAALGDGDVGAASDACQKLGLDTAKPNGGLWGESGYLGTETAHATPEEQAVAKALDFVSIGKDAGEEEQRYVFGPVLIPNTPTTPDLQGDTYTADEIRRTEQRWMTEYQNRTIQHSEDPEKPAEFLDPSFANDKILLTDSVILPVPMTIGSRTFPAGTWMMGAVIADDTEWGNVKAGRKTGWSIGGLARRTPIEQVA